MEIYGIILGIIIIAISFYLYLKDFKYVFQGAIFMVVGTFITGISLSYLFFV